LKAVLVLGFLFGLRHALDADHLAAVASLATRNPGLRRAAARGAAWGLGHTVTLLLVGGCGLLLGARIPPGWARAAEAAVGVMLVALGIDVFRRLRRRGVHFHPHRHSDGTVHFHAHGHEPAAAHDAAHHEHRHPLPRRAIWVGMVHGLAGSAALLLLTLQAVGSLWLGLLYIALFGLGSAAGMALLSAAIALPLRASARRVHGLDVGLERVVGVATVLVGLWALVRAAV